MKRLAGFLSILAALSLACSALSTPAMDTTAPAPQAATQAATSVPSLVHQGTEEAPAQVTGRHLR